MIRMIGNHICKDCVSAMEVIQRERLPIEFHDMEKALDYVREFLEIRSFIRRHGKTTRSGSLYSF